MRRGDRPPADSAHQSRTPPATGCPGTVLSLPHALTAGRRLHAALPLLTSPLTATYPTTDWLLQESATRYSESTPTRPRPQRRCTLQRSGSARARRLARCPALAGQPIVPPAGRHTSLLSLVLAASPATACAGEQWDSENKQVTCPAPQLSSQPAECVTCAFASHCLAPHRDVAKCPVAGTDTP